MSKLWKPMLAAKPDPEDLDAIIAKLPYPALFSPKLDGIRATVQNGKLYSRSLKLIPNLEMQKLWGRKELNGLDGEIIVGHATSEDCFNRSTSTVMSRSKPAEEAVFCVFDTFGSDDFDVRTGLAKLTAGLSNTMSYVEHEFIEDHAQLMRYEALAMKLGHEGVMRRTIDGRYKQGRSTLKEGGLIAIKRTVDAEAVILDTYEQMENTNEKTQNELGKSKRSSHKAGKVGKGTLGGFTVAIFNVTLAASEVTRMQNLARQKVHDPRIFNIATGVGLTNDVRSLLWAGRAKLPGKIIKFRYQKIGTMVAPRQPIFLGFRDERDL